MTRKTPDMREAKRLKKIEDEKQSKRMKAAYMVMDGHSYREVAKCLHVSHQTVSNWAHRYLKKKVTVINGKKKVTYTMRESVKELIKSRKPGPKPGNHPVADAIREKVVHTKKKYPRLGAEKIRTIAKVEASAPTVRKVLYEAGFEPVTIKKGKAYKSFERPYSNDLWQIDYVVIGKDRITGQDVEFLSVIDDHSRKILSVNSATHATTDDVLNIMRECVETYGVPRQILSDHGTQWYATRGGDARFDEWCKNNGIEHIMGGIRKPTTTGKVERWHGTIRREAGLPERGSVEEYRDLIENFVFYYNYERPHYANGLTTPAMAYEFGIVC